MQTAQAAVRRTNPHSGPARNYFQYSLVLSCSFGIRPEDNLVKGNFDPNPTEAIDIDKIYPASSLTYLPIHLLSNPTLRLSTTKSWLL
jgi:hypothetical protein